MAAIPMSIITDAVISGIEKAQIDYEEMSGGEWLWSSAEYVLTTYIAREINNLRGSKLITIEHSGLAAVTDASAVGPGPKPRKARLNGRFDLLLWWANGTPRAVIEVKNQLAGPAVWYSDIERILAVLDMRKADSSFKFGLFAYYYSVLPGKKYSAEERIERKMKATEELINRSIDRNSKIRGRFSVTQKSSEKIHDYGEYGAWTAACIIIQRVG